MTCFPIDGTGPIEQSAFGDLKFCGKEMDAVMDGSMRLDPSKNICPSGKRRCSTTTDNENTICVEGDLVANCPITSLHTFTEDERLSLEDDPGYVFFSEEPL